MNAVFTIDEKLKVKLKLVMGTTCGKIEDLTEELEDIVEGMEEEMREEELIGKLLAVDMNDDENELYELVEWDGAEFDCCGIFIEGKTYTLKCLR